ncbi:unnamed protein product [Didymodactylos carnosus]|uniref:Selenoprotein P N-terminal domain-containing protein n=1 Tax=Didymodactylos carnosus TaxID=1234261 RepID=A0A813R2T7_9BILA|nr:unnamed protein product [Didymodactylos carnosus]CAF3558294.1 unnamed protein product [Didymodactylos carnosus]
MVSDVPHYNTLTVKLRANLTLNGTNLITMNRKKLLVVGLLNFACPTCWNQATRFNDLYNDLQHKEMTESVVQILLINEKRARNSYTQSHFQKLRVLQDNENDEIIKKLGGKSMDTFVFGRCGYLQFSQHHPDSLLENPKNYQLLLNQIYSAVKNKRRCQKLCS